MSTLFWSSTLVVARTWCLIIAPWLQVTSWDATVRLYDARQNQQKLKYQHDGAVLDGCFVSHTESVSAGLDCAVMLYDLKALAHAVPP